MEYISEQEYQFYRCKIEFYKKHCENIKMPCAICGEKSTNYVQSIIGVIRWYMCENHKTASPYLGAGSMGVTFNGVDTEMKYLDEQDKIKEKLRNIKIN